MSTLLTRSLTVIAAFVLAASLASAQSLLKDNPDYKKAQDLQKQAKAMFDQGEYDKGNELAKQAQTYSKKAKDSSMIMFMKYRANSWKVRAEEQIGYASLKGAPTNEAGAAVFSQATNYYQQGNIKVLAAEKVNAWPQVSNTYVGAITDYSNASIKGIESKDLALAWERKMALMGPSRELIDKAQTNLAALKKDRIVDKDDDDDKSVTALITDAEAAYSNRAYDVAYTKGKAAVDLTDQIRKREEANNLYSLAAAGLDGAKGSGFDTSKPQEYQEIENNVNNAKTALDKENFDDSIRFSKDALATLEKIGAGSILPEKYTVRLIPKRRDCLWRIAEYHFVYSNGIYWHVLYDANKSTLKYPDNPHLIFPGQVFTIPSLRGEKRSGMFDENKRYGTFNIRQYTNAIRAASTTPPMPAATTAAPVTKTNTAAAPAVKKEALKKAEAAPKTQTPPKEAIPAKETKPKEPVRLPGVRY
ncbi:MAG: LysM peptidoglycan-binding domain-containing protein [Spirochaetes bacterium]|nr:LysM peptidoglycan-binding domain-containing protein [Spirochaetota bacterium]